MQHLKVANHQAAATLAAEVFGELSDEQRESPLGLATGATMAGVYEQLAATSWRPGCSDVFALDEYIGLEPTHPNSFEAELRMRFVRPLAFGGRLHVPGQGEYRGPEGYARFEQQLAKLGPVQVQLLGLGTNGHVAFNEPGAALESATREVDLAEATLAANSQFFDNPATMPGRAVTQGLATIAGSKHLLLVATSEAKRPALLRAITEGGVENPLSALLDHPGLIVITDFSLD